MVRSILRMLMIAAAVVVLWSAPAESQSVPCNYSFPLYGILL